MILKYASKPGRAIGKIFVLAIVGIVIVFVIVMLILGVKPVNNRQSAEIEDDYELVLIQKAREIYTKKVQEGVDMTLGPCLDNELDVDWVLDIAHEPRQAIDNFPENQCSAFREGKAKHFVELDPAGNLIQIK